MQNQMIAAAVWALPLVGLLIFAAFFDSSSQNTIESIRRCRTAVTPQLFDTLLTLHVTLWIIPFSGLLAVPILLVTQLAQKVRRDNWKNSWKLKTSFIAIWFFCLLVSSAVPVQSFDGPTQWGLPLVDDDPNVALWPATEQKVWLLERGEGAPVVVTVMHQRIPATFSGVGTAEFSAWATEVFNIDEKRLIETARQFGIAEEHFELRDIETEGHHRYRSADGDIDIDLVAARRQVITHFPFENTVVSELVTIYIPKWGGEMWALTITRTPSSSAIDPWAEDIMLEWLRAH